jgi:uncharacterized protein
VLRYSELRIDASSLQTLRDGSIKVVAQLTHPGIFTYRNPDGSERKEYRPADEVFRTDAMATFAGAAITIDHPRVAGRFVNAQNWKQLAVGHAGENIRQDGEHMVADLYIRDSGAVDRIRRGDLKTVSLGYNVDFDPTPGTAPDGQRFDGVQRNLRGNHIALLPNGVAPRGGPECTLRLDSAGDEIEVGLKSRVDLETALAKIVALEAELKTVRTDAVEVPALKAKITALEGELASARTDAADPSGERLDALVEARATIVALAKANGVDAKGKSAVQVKRAIIGKRTPALAARLDSMDEAACDAVMTVYSDQPHKSMTTAVAVVAAEVARTDAVDPNAVPKVADLHSKFVAASKNAWQNKGDMPVRN